MATAFEQQRSSSQYAELSFDDRLGLLVDTEWTARESRKLTQRLRHAKLRYPASLEDVDFSTPRGLSREVVLTHRQGIPCRMADPRRRAHRLRQDPNALLSEAIASSRIRQGSAGGGLYLEAVGLLSAHASTVQAAAELIVPVARP